MFVSYLFYVFSKFLLQSKGVRSVELRGLLGRRVKLERGLALEVVHTVLLWSSNPRVRGGPYCLPNLPRILVSEMEALGEALESCRERDAERVAAVQRVAGTLGKDCALHKHLHGLCYSCGGRFPDCSCRISFSVYLPITSEAVC